MWRQLCTLLFSATIWMTPAAFATGIGNPAATFCAGQGGSYTLAEGGSGELGMCALPDGRVVDAWTYFRDTHAASGDAAALPAMRIWTGGPILTMVDGAMRAEALAERDGLIVGVGSLEEVMALQGPDTQIVDLAGRALIPGFVDAHGHVFAIGMQALSANLLAAPDGAVNSVAEMQAVLRAFADAQPERVAAANLILGFGYDDAQLSELRHPTRAELDAVSSEIPVLAIHQSGHLGVANSVLLQQAGVTAATPDPAGGVIRREADGVTPDGVLEETAFFAVMGQTLGTLDVVANRALFLAGTELIASFGYTTAQEGRSNPSVSALMRAVAAEGPLDIDVVSYLDVLIDRDAIVAEYSPDYTNRYRVAGGKLTIDGSPQGFTALRDRPYFRPPDGFRADYAGYTAASRDQVFDAVDWAYANDVQLLTHANGEGASDILIAALETATAAHGAGDRRPVLIHGQFQRPDQVAAYDRLGVFPSLFPMHTFYWGDWHRERTVGPVAADDISPTGWVLERGMRFSTHHDAPVAFPDSMRVLSATVTRRSRSGDIIGPRHRVDVLTALKAMTLWPAYQHFEEDRKGSLELGKLADLVILSGDPTAIDPETLADLTVLETIKEGVTIYAADVTETRNHYLPPGDGTDPYAHFMRAFAISRDLQTAQGRPSRFAPSLLARAPHSSACVARSLTDLMTASLMRDAALKATGGEIALP